VAPKYCSIKLSSLCTLASAWVLLEKMAQENRPFSRFFNMKSKPTLERSTFRKLGVWPVSNKKSRQATAALVIL
jgi:hypothetical protein